MGQIKVDCDYCDGNGFIKRLFGMDQCFNCDGQGYIIQHTKEDNVIRNVFPNINNPMHNDEPLHNLEIPTADQCLQGSIGHMSEVLIIGYDTQGEEVFLCNLAEGSKAMWHLQRAIQRLMKAVDDEQQT